MKTQFCVLTMVEFMKLTRSPRNCWMFKTMNHDESKFYKKNDIVYFENGHGVIRRFKASHGKILFDMKRTTDKRWGIWSNWDASEW